MAASPARTESRAAERVRCPGCTKPQRHECIGRRDERNRPLCSCLQCHGAAIRADAERYTDPMVVELRRYVMQVRHRDRQAATWPQKPRRQTCAAPNCGNTAVSRRFGPRRKHCSDACRQRAYRARRARKRGAAREQAMAEILPVGAARTATSGPEPAGTGDAVPEWLRATLEEVSGGR